MRELVKDASRTEITADEVIEKVENNDNFIEVAAVLEDEVYTLRRSTVKFSLPIDLWGFVFTKMGNPRYSLEGEARTLEDCLRKDVYGNPDIYVFEDKDEYLNFLRDNL